MKIYLIFKDYNKRIKNLLDSFNIQHDKSCSMALIINSNTLELYNRNNPKQKSIKVDFTSKKNNYRCCNIRKKSEILSKVVGIKKPYYPFILDATAGLGNDAFIFSYLGCKVVMIERNPIVAALLTDGLYRGYNHDQIGNWLQKRLHLLFADSLNMLNIPLQQPDVIYLDPMYPVHKKKSLPKKNMQLFRALIKQNNDSESLLTLSRKLAKNRVIVKRPCYARPLSEDKVNFIIRSKNHRFDIYHPF